MHIERNMVISQTMTMIKKFAKVFFIVDFSLIVLCVIFADFSWLINTQFAFVSSVLITIATFVSYTNNVQKRLENFEPSDLDNDRDKIDEIDDPFDLYSEDIVQEDKELSTTEIKTIIKEEKSKVKRNSFKNTVSTTTSFMSIYRIGGYFLLIVGLLYLTNNQLFEPIPYLIGLFVVPLSMLLAHFILSEEVNQ